MASTIEQAIIDYLKDDTTIAGYVGGKIYFLEKDKNAVNEYIVIANPSHTRDAITQTKQKGGQARLTVNCFSRDKWRAKAIGEAVVDALKNKYGTIEGMDVWNISVTDARPLAGPGEFRYMTDVIVNYNR